LIVREADDQTASGRCVDDIELERRRAGEEMMDDDVEQTSPQSADLLRVYRMRSFYCKSGNIVNRGDSVRMRGGGGARRARDPASGSSIHATGSSIHPMPDRAASAKQFDDGGRTAAANGATEAAAARSDTAPRDFLTVGHISTSGPV